jgi:hypothetical protein
VVLGLVMAVAGVCGTELARSASPTNVDMGAGGIEGYLLSAAVALPLCLRRRYPLVVLVAIALLFFTAGERVPVAFSPTSSPRQRRSWRSTRRRPGRRTAGG